MEVALDMADVILWLHFLREILEHCWTWDAEQLGLPCISDTRSTTDLLFSATVLGGYDWCNGHRWEWPFICLDTARLPAVCRFSRWSQAFGNLYGRHRAEFIYFLNEAVHNPLSINWTSQKLALSDTILCYMITITQRKDDGLNYHGNTLYENSSPVPYTGSISSLCFQLSEIQHNLGNHCPDSPTQKALLGSDKRDEIVTIEDHQSFGLELPSNTFDQHFADQQMQKLARGKYKCSRCGALKVRISSLHHLKYTSTHI